MKKIINQHIEKIRFGIVGAINTAIDFALLFGFVYIGLEPLVGNMISTTAALIFSFFANKKYTFNDKNASDSRQFILFLVITLFGLWILQPFIIWLTMAPIEQITNIEYVALFISKTTATMVSLVWNYVMYRRFVFKGAL